MQVLVVDDSKTMRMILKKILEKMGFQVVEAGNGREALDLLRETAQPDLVLVDWNMPEMSGVEFVRSVRTDRTHDTLPLVMVTTNVELEHVAEALEAGANEYVMKPFTIEVIREKLDLLGFTEA